MPVSQDPAHVADRHLEKLQALVRLVRAVADTADEGDWQDLRPGLQLLSVQIEDLAADARNALDGTEQEQNKP